MTAAVAQTLSQRIGAERYGLWFENKTKLEVDERHLRIGVPNHFYQEWLDKTFGSDIQTVAQELMGPGVRISFRLDPELFRAARQREGQTELPSSPEVPV